MKHKSPITFTAPAARRMARDILEMAAADPARRVDATMLSARGWSAADIARHGPDARALAAASRLGQRLAEVEQAA